MRQLIAALLFACSFPASAAWVLVWSEPSGGAVYFENATMSFSGPVASGTNPFIRATIYTDYTSAINSDRVCYPSGGDCQWKRLNVTVTYDWSCNNIVRLHKVDEQWDSGPTSQSYDPKRDNYNIPEPRVHVAAPAPIAAGGTYNITNEQGLIATQYAICRSWPK